MTYHACSDETFLHELANVLFDPRERERERERACVRPGFLHESPVQNHPAQYIMGLVT